MIWSDGFVPFLFSKGGSGVQANCSLCDSEVTLSFFAGSVCSRFSAEACAILQALRWSRQHQQVCHFSFPLRFSLYPRHSVLLRLSFYLKLSGRNYLLFSPSLSCYNRSPDTPGNDAADELARRVALLFSSAIPCSLSPLTSRIHSCLFSDWRRTVSSKFFDTQVPSVTIEKLVLSRLRSNGHSLLLNS